MPILAGLILSLAGQLASFLGLFFAKRVAIGGAAVATFAVLTVAVYGVLAGLIGSVSAAFPGWPGLQTAIWVATPPTVPGGITAAIAADAAIALYRWNRENVRLLAAAS